MATQGGTNIKDLLKQHPRGVIVTARELLRIGITREQQRSLVASAWLRRVGTGAYAMLDDKVDLNGALYALQKQAGLSVHQGGYTALARYHGMAHNLVAGRRDQLFCARNEGVPAWFKNVYGASCSLYPVTVFAPRLGLVDRDAGGFSLQASGPERALMEMLYLVPAEHTLSECFQIMELLVNPRPALVQELLEGCGSVRIKRLFLYMADLAGHAWMKRLDPSKIDLGSGVREITKGGSLDKKYQLVIGEVRAI